eukprot:m.333173 g.333173  ORF g.333173 m.333173 type:complete len:91 (+) comp17087_c0_seq1:746-1018(+)
MLILEKEEVKNWRPHVPLPDQFRRAQAAFVAQVLSGQRTLEDILAEGADRELVDWLKHKLNKETPTSQTYEILCYQNVPIFMQNIKFHLF